jgi:hypothetical protein
MPQLNGKHFSYDAKGYAQYEAAKKKKNQSKGKKNKKKSSTLRGSIMGGGY